MSKKERAVVIYDYSPQFTNTDELELKEGQIVYITDRSNEASGWFEGELNGKLGVFPTTYVEFVKEGQNSNNVISPNNIKADIAATNDFLTPKPVSNDGPTYAEKTAISKKKVTLFSLYAHYSAIMTSLFYAYTGFIVLMWGTYGNAPYPTYDNPRYFNYSDAIIGFLCLFSGLGVYFYEIRYGVNRANVNPIPFRAIIYTILCIPGIFAIPTLVGALTLFTSAMINLVSTLHRESYRQQIVPPKKVDKKNPNNDDDDNKVKSCCLRFCYMISGKNPDRQVARVIFLILYIAVNIIAGALHSKKAYDEIQEAKRFNRNNIAFPSVPPIPNKTYHSEWVVFAKFWGNIMNFNFTFILIPVSHSLMRWLVDKSRGRNAFAMFIRGILWFFPVDDSIKIHKMIAYVGFCAALLHTTGHLFNYVLKAEHVWNKFGITVWITGSILILILFILYPATNVNVKRGHFEIFWVTHMLYLFLFITCLIHGRNTWGPNYWKWFIGPGVIYVIERLYREYITRQPVKVMSVTFMSNSVISIEVAKSGALENYIEGQYAYILCPTLSRLQWHPFTISSAPQEETVTFHIRIQGQGSWTYKLREYFRVLGSGSNKACLRLAHVEDNKIIPGLVEGPDGSPILRIHGPYSAPTQHFCEYNEVIICASGIGVTPLASALKSIVHFRWKYSVDRAFPDNATFVWVAAHREIPSFRWLVRTIKEAEDGLVHLKSKLQTTDEQTRSLRIMIYITSYSKTEADKFLRSSAGEKDVDDAGLWGNSYFGEDEQSINRKRVSYTESELYAALMNPQKDVVQFGNVTVTLGRPKWEDIFGYVHMTTKEKDVGVTFCGNPLIGKDLKENCFNFTQRDNKRVVYHLHKEVF